MNDSLQFALPAQGSPAAVGHEVRSSRTQPAPAPATLQGVPERPRLLLVDDDLDTRAICRCYLEHHGYVVSEAPTGEAGLRSARSLRPHVVILDLQLPDLPGWGVVQAIHADAMLARTRILIFTAHVNPLDRERADAQRCAGYLLKPTPLATLLHTVEAALSASPCPGGAGAGAWR